MPSICRPFQEGYSYLETLCIIYQFYQFEIYIKLVAKTRYTGTIHAAIEALRQLQLDGGGQSWLGGILQTTNLSLLYSQAIL